MAHLDFTERCWGHALHAGTWSAAPPRVVGRLWRKRVVERVTVLAHCQAVKPGDTLSFNTASGNVRRVLVAEVENLGDPRDMWKLTLEPLPPGAPND